MTPYDLYQLGQSITNASRENDLGALFRLDQNGVSRGGLFQILEFEAESTGTAPSASAELEIRHNLGRIPSLLIPAGFESMATTTQAEAIAYTGDQKRRWTSSTIVFNYRQERPAGEGPKIMRILLL